MIFIFIWFPKKGREEYGREVRKEVDFSWFLYILFQNHVNTLYNFKTQLNFFLNHKKQN